MAKKETQRSASKKTVKVKKTKSSNGYGAEHIQVLEGLEPVRRRPGMYIGTTGPDGVHHLIVEVFDNSRDEAMAGFGGDIELVFLPGNRIRVADNGRGIPVERHPQTKTSTLETVLTTLHAGGKFGAGGYTVTGGLHGVGVSVVNALSGWLRAEVHRDGGKFAQEYHSGEPLAPVKRSGSSERTGTIITFEPDATIFKDGISFDWKRVVDHMRQQAYLVRGMRITLLDAREFAGKLDDQKMFYLRDLGLDLPSMSFYFEGGLLSLVRFYNQSQKPVHKSIFYIEKEARTLGVESVEIALQYVDDISCRILAFANNTFNNEGGTHLTGFKSSLTRTLNAYARANNLLKEKDENFTGEDVLEGLTALISVKLREIQFEGQTKGKLGSVEARTAVENVMNEALGAFLEENPDEARAIVGKVSLAMRARKAAKAAKDSVLRKGALEGMTLPGKLADCQSKKREETELFVVEGDSAGGCLVGETKVALADGRAISFRELVAEQKSGARHYCYTIDEHGSVAIVRIESPRVTRRMAQVVKLTLDNGEEVVCTPDHRFMLRDGTYRAASALTRDDSLMPLYRKVSEIGGRITIKGYEMLFDSAKRHWIFTHLLSDQYNQQQGVYCREYGDVIHHKDFNKRNNNPDNLVPLGRQEHLTLHTRHLEKTLHRDDVKELCTALKRTEAYRDRARMEEAVVNYNHRVVKMEWLEERIDVYDLEVPGTHNFALASGVFVHNSAKMARDRATQAILPLFGKVLNAERARLDKILASDKFRALVIALGTGIGEGMDIDKLRYGRIIIMADADVDGSHIKTLYLTFFFRQLRDIIERGHLYIAVPPLYKITRGKEAHYVFTDDEKAAYLKTLGVALDEVSEVEEEGEAEAASAGGSAAASEMAETASAASDEKSKKPPKVSVQRYKGLGEMSADELWETTMDPKSRLLYHVTIEDAVEADKVFDILMGTDVPARKSFIQSNAKLANLDI